MNVHFKRVRPVANGSLVPSCLPVVSKMGPRSLQDCPRTASNMTKKGIDLHVNLIIHFWSSWAPFGALWGHLGSQGVVLESSGCPLGTQRWHQKWSK